MIYYIIYQVSNSAWNFYKSKQRKCVSQWHKQMKLLHIVILPSSIAWAKFEPTWLGSSRALRILKALTTVTADEREALSRILKALTTVTADEREALSRIPEALTTVTADEREALLLWDILLCQTFRVKSNSIHISSAYQPWDLCRQSPEWHCPDKRSLWTYLTWNQIADIFQAHLNFGAS